MGAKINMANGLKLFGTLAVVCALTAAGCLEESGSSAQAAPGGAAAAATANPGGASATTTSTSGGAPTSGQPTAHEDGTPTAPFVIQAFPYTTSGDTQLAPTREIDLYSCAGRLLEEGPEIYYVLTLAETGTLSVEVEEDAGVDVDLHLLRSLQTAGRVAMDCVERANTQLVIENLVAGAYFLVVDTYSRGNTVYAGAYRLAVEFDTPGLWQQVDVDPALTWKKLSGSGPYGTQTINVLEFDPASTSFEFTAQSHGGCAKTSSAGSSTTAMAALNGGFFASGCQSLCLVKTAGVTSSTNHLDSQPRRSLGVTAQGAVLFEAVPARSDWPAAWQAMGGHPNLVTQGVVDIWPLRSTSFYTARHPRTGVGVTAAGHVLLVTVDGRTAAGAGMTINGFAQLMVDLGATEAINLDGGGSTTMWIRDMSINGIVNYPSDNRKADHFGERSVSDGLVIYRR